ncbi:MAG: SLBB domain-containing protein [Acidobacteriia bacterium]|nr:SLBB domain-containing protein [Terriglobia bacterium]
MQDFVPVSATVSQIAAVLASDPGLFLELKRLASQEAASKGQIILESDLTDAAILARLRQDLKFRVTATGLLQRYGHLLPKTKPGVIGSEEETLKKARIPRVPEGLNRNELQSAVGSGRTIPSPAELPKDTSSPELLASPSAEGGLLARASSRLTTTSADNADEEDKEDKNLSQLGTSQLAGAYIAPPPAAVPTVMTSDTASSSTSQVSTPAVTPPPQREKKPRAGSFQAVQASESEMPGMERHKSPYSDIPSMYDIYIHAGPNSGPVRRFGEDIFENGADMSSGIPIDFPASPDYVVGPGDGLMINLWGGVSQRLERTVDHQGRISIPEVGPVFVSGKPLGEVQLAVQRELRTMFRTVSADVSLSRLRTVRIYVVGDVNGPGAYDVSSLSTPLNVLLAAGGPTSGGSMRLVKQFRGNTLVQQVDLYDLLLRGIRSDLKPLQPGDTLLVPPVGTQVRIDGMVRRPALYELNGETTLAQVIELAGGILPTAALNHIEVQRLVAHEKRTMLSLDVSGNSDMTEIEKKLASFTISDRDEVHIFPIASFNQNAVYLQGHVLREGRYSYKPGMRLTDLVSSYADLLPEPSTAYAEIIRLTPPDYHPSLESFHLGEALANPATAPKLQPLDTVRIFGRYDFEETPGVIVSGAVRKPGLFQTPGRIHFLDAIQLAGGLTPDASMDSAQIIRPMADSSVQILNVQLKDALNGDPINNVLLGPRDRILIQENILRDDPRSVLIAGDVANPGRYPLTSNLRISDLIRIAGGLKRGADENTADLTQFITAPNAPVVAKHMNVSVARAMVGDPADNVSLNDGDVLTIHEVPGWSDVGASVVIEGEVRHPGTYGIRSGERLSSVLERAGSFQPEGYPYGAILRREQVQELETQSRDELIMRVRNAQNDLGLQPDTDLKAKAARELAYQQWQSNLDALSANPPSGRIAIRISTDINRWKNTPADIQLLAGDTLIIPKKPGVVMVTGQVFNPTAVSHRPGRSAKWYLTQAGGTTPLANKKAIFVVKADGSVIGSKNGLWSGDSLRAALQPGDMVVVPEKALSGNVPWQNILLSAQVAASMATAVIIGLHY